MRKIFILLLLIVCILVNVEAQRGRRSRSRSRSSRRSSSWGSSRRHRSSAFSWWGSPENQTLCANGTNSTQCQEQGIQFGDFSWEILFLIPLGIYHCFGWVIFQNDDRDKRISDIMDEFESSNKNVICALDSKGKQDLKDWFMGHKWHMQYQLNSQGKNQTVSVTLRNISNRSDKSYNIKMSMRDKIGGSQACGILTINRDHFKIKLEKTYENRKIAGQVNKYDILLYEGDQEGEQFFGNWFYKNFQDDPDFSGTWRMYHE